MCFIFCRADPQKPTTPAEEDRDVNKLQKYNEGNVLETQGNNIELQTPSEFSTKRGGCELYEVVVEKARIRAGESRKSRRVCDLYHGVRVLSNFINPNTNQFRMDLPVVGWASLTSRKDPQNPHVFKKVPAETLMCLTRRFWLELELGRGSFGCVYAGWDTMDKNRVAIKIDQPKRNKRSNFGREVEILKRVQSVKKVPRMLFYGLCDQEPFLGNAFMVLELQGLSLSVIKKNYLEIFSQKTVLMLGIEAVKILRDVHKCGVVHRDIKPANFVVDRNNYGRGIHLLDFGLSVLFVKPDGNHIDFREGASRCGTARYASLGTHRRNTQSRRDDLEALGYVLLLFVRGLPWKQHKGEDPDKKWERIFNEKMRWPVETLCQGMSSAFVKYFNHVRALRFEDRPDYERLISMFEVALQEEGFSLDLDYDWVKLFET